VGFVGVGGVCGERLWEILEEYGEVKQFKKGETIIEVCKGRRRGKGEGGRGKEGRGEG
jgi:hypothetical protein